MIDDGARVWLADVDGDGKADLVAQGAIGRPTSGWVFVALSDGTGFPHWSWTSGERMLDDSAKSWLVDVNGDGKADLVTQGVAGSHAGWVSVGLSDAGVFAHWSWSSGERILDDTSNTWLVDVNGDGQADLVTQGFGGDHAGWVSVGLSDAGSFAHWSWSSAERVLEDDSASWFADVNRDGRADLISKGGFGRAGWVSVGLSDGRAFAHWSWVSGKRLLDDDAMVWLVDVNGDARADLVTQGGETGGAAGWVSVGLSDGLGFGWWSWSSEKRELEASSTTWFADMNGDGVLDLVTESSATTPAAVGFGRGNGLTFGPTNMSWGW